MIISVEELRKYIDTNESDEILAVKMQAIEMMIRKCTGNNFQERFARSTADIVGGAFLVETDKFFRNGDTIQVSESKFNDGIFVVDGNPLHNELNVTDDVVDEKNVLITRIVYPADVVMGAVNMLKWDLENRNKVGIQSETISRHSVTYFNMDGLNSEVGYPKSLLGFLKPYRKARF